MPTIQIDDEVFAHLQRHATPLVDNPNSTLRRLLSIDSPKSEPEPDELEALPRKSQNLARNSRKRAPKADMHILVAAGLLKQGEELYLVDYQGNKLDGRATVDGKHLIHDGKQYTMSRLAQELLEQAGYSSKEIRGPSHWATKKGETVTKIWAAYQEQVSKSEAEAPSFP